MSAPALDLRARLSLEHPILQVGFAGGLASPELAAAVSRAGGLGMLGLVAADELSRQLARARELAPGRPLAVNLLMPFARRAHIDACVEARVAAVMLFFGYRRDWVRRLRDAGIFVLHQVGTAGEARRALADGADALVAQGREAGGHLLGVVPARAALADVLAASDGAPVLLAGGVVDAASVRAALAAGASGVVCGTRFLLSDECRAHPGYKARVLGATRTIETRLFGFGWPARHRVVPNAATDRWCAASPDGPALARAVNRLSAPLARVVPLRSAGAFLRAQRLAIPIYSPAGPREGDDEKALDVAPLYAGEAARDVRAVLPAEAIVRELAAGLA
jgi:nitronate monooxygenase